MEQRSEFEYHKDFYTPYRYSFDLHQDMMEILQQEFEIEKVVSNFEKACVDKGETEIDEIGKQIFGEYGKDLTERALQLGQEYPDRTYEVLRYTNDKLNGAYLFPLIPQRFIEIAYLSTHPEMRTLRVTENNSQRFSYKVDERCHFFHLLKGECGERVANLLPCKHSCLTIAQTAFSSWGLDVITEMVASMTNEGFCKFAVRKAELKAS